MHGGPIAATPDDAVAELFFGQDGIDNPNPYFHYLRDTAPVHRSGTGAIFLTRYDDCRELLRDNRFGKVASGANLVPNADPEVDALRRQRIEQARTEGRRESMLFLNPPHHTRQRNLVSRAFTPRRVGELRSQIRVLADHVVDDFVERGGGDLLEHVGFPLPVAVIGTLVGVPEADWHQFRELISTSAAAIEPAATADEIRAASESNRIVRDYFDDLIEQRRRDPKDDLLSDMIAVEEAGDSLHPDEITAVAVLLFAAGFETTTNLIGNSMGALLRNPDEMQRLWSEPDLLPSAVEEVLRWDSPVQFDARTAMEPADVFGESVDKGTRVVTLLGAANRDPSHFDDPDRFDVARDEGPPMSFASGIHFCLGANLARVEGHEVFGSLIERCATIEQDGPLVQRPRMTLRGFQSVPVRVEAR